MTKRKPPLCHNCGTLFTKSGPRNTFCSFLCAFTARMPPREPDSCWEWPGAKNDRGYGQIRLSGRVTYTHRISYEAFVRPIPPGLEVMHRCDNPACCHPDHLTVGTHFDNMRDMTAKGRRRFPEVYKCGEALPQSKITDAVVTSIREAAKSGIPYREIARQYGTSFSTVQRVVARATWRHVP